MSEVHPPAANGPERPDKGRTLIGAVFGALRSITPGIVGGFVFTLVLIGLVFFSDRARLTTFATKLETPPPVEPPPTLPRQTEEAFLNGLKNEPAATNEWWAARSDHRLVAYAIFNCKQLSDVTMDSMPRQFFSALLLDLTPEGNHLFRMKESDGVLAAARNSKASPPVLTLTSAEQDLLSLSDSIARARVAAADGANVNVPWVQRLGIATLIVAALATLFVTLQGKMKPVEFDEPEKKAQERASWWSRVRFNVYGPGSGFRWVAFWAITLSIAGTALTGVKQVYDPTRTLTQNTRAMLDLRQLHQDVVLGVRCQDKTIATHPKMPQWIDAIRRIRATIIPEYGAYANLDVGGSQRSDGVTAPPPNAGQNQPAEAPRAGGTTTPEAR